jgi:hypothetical protein
MSKQPWYLSVVFWITTLVLIASALSLLSKTLTNAHVAAYLAVAAGAGFALETLFENDGSEIVGGPRSAPFWVFVASGVIVVLQVVPTSWTHQAGAIAAGLLALVVTYLTSLGVLKNKATAYASRR